MSNETSKRRRAMITLRISTDHSIRTQVEPPSDLTAVSRLQLKQSKCSIMLAMPRLMQQRSRQQNHMASRAWEHRIAFVTISTILPTGGISQNGITLEPTP